MGLVSGLLLSPVALAERLPRVFVPSVLLASGDDDAAVPSMFVPLVFLLSGCRLGRPVAMMAGSLRAATSLIPSGPALDGDLSSGALSSSALIPLALARFSFEPLDVRFLTLLLTGFVEGDVVLIDIDRWPVRRSGATDFRCVKGERGEAD